MKNTFLKITVFGSKHNIHTIFYTLPIPITYLHFDSQVVRKLAKKYHITTVEELMRVSNNDLKRIKNKTHKKIIFEIKAQIQKIITCRIVKNFKDKYSVIRKILSELNHLFNKDFKEIILYLKNYKPYKNGFLFA